VVLLGLMASGKSSVGRILASRLGRPFRDNDEQLEQELGTTAGSYADSHGLTALHAAELDILARSLRQPDPAVISAAASVGDRPDLAEILSGHRVVWIDVDPLVLAARVARGRDHRPVSAEAVTQLRAQRQRRAPRFRAVADVILTWRDEEAEVLAGRILDRLDLGPRRP
jgi:shikimate kinase